MKMKVKIDEKVFDVEVGDLTSRPIIASVDGEEIAVWPEAPAAAEITSASPAVSTGAMYAAKKSAEKPQAVQDDSSVAAPIPGVIVEVCVSTGDKVKYGQELCVLEAMKMKNSIRAGRDATVKTVHAKVGEHVHQSQMLVEFETEGQA